MALTFVMPRPSVPSGGHAYNQAMVAHWPGPPPATVQLDGPWPRGDDSSRRALSAALQNSDAVLLDGLVGAAAPELIEEEAARGARIVLLVHLPLAAEGGLSDADRRELAALERRSVRAAWRVLATSRTAASDLARSTGRSDIVAVPPGVEPAPAAEPHDPPRLLQVGSIGPRKNQLTTLVALTACLDLPWTATFVGPVADPDYAERFRAGLGGARSGWAGPLQGAELATAYAEADLLLHPAHAETWGMVVTEALARGVPAIVGAGTGAVEALGSGSPDVLPGAAVPSDDPGALAEQLRRWLADPALRDEWRQRAQRARTALRGWPEAAAELARAAAKQ
ncbi:MAG: glycosyltransferase family 4 protein [Micropruina sp.]|uniref:glycosyltransferase family 4 protein n=1 Tax=Micropruina sp. TaxID=2737536 RepID=UPI0039E6B8B4